MNQLEVQRPSAGYCCWFTGLPAAGKTTLALQLRERLRRQGVQALLLDGDRLRTGLNRDLGFSREDRRENVRRIAEMAHFLVAEGFVVLVASISPYGEDRAAARRLFSAESFYEVFLSTDLATCMGRDPKGLYALAQAGKISNLTGLNDCYERPESPHLSIDTGTVTVEQAVARLIQLLPPAIPHADEATLAHEFGHGHSFGLYAVSSENGRPAR